MVLNFYSPEQAQKEMDRRVQFKVDRKGWSKEKPETSLPRPMLAKDYVSDDTYFMVVASPKLDGVRAYWSGTQLLSRTNTVYTSVPHIVEALKSLPPRKYDGEIYHPDFSLEMIVSASRQINPDALSRQLEFHIFDVMEDGTSYSRTLSLAQMKIPENSPIKLVPHTVTTSNLLPVMASKFVEQGFEGLVFRGFEDQYHYDERKMYRIKPIHRETFIVKGVQDTPRARGLAMLQFEGFNATINYPKDAQAYLFRNPQNIIGKPVTVEFRGYTEKGIPRNAKVVKIPLECFGL